MFVNSRFPYHLLLCCLAWALTPPTAHANNTNTRVQAQPLRDIAIYPQLTAPATVISLNDTDISAEINGVVLEIPIRVGDIVDKGTLLARLDCRSYELVLKERRARLRAFKAQLTLAEKKLQRARSLRHQETLAEELLNERETDVLKTRADTAALESSLDSAMLDIERCQLKSPYKAVVTERLASVGQYASIGVALLHLIDIQGLEVSAQMVARLTPQLTQTRDLTFAAHDKRYPLRLRTVVPVLNTKSRNQEVRLTFSEKAALPGTAGQLLWRGTQPHLPAKWLVRRTGHLGIFIVQGQQARFHPLPKAQAGRPAELALPPTTPIITAGYLGLNDGEAINFSGKHSGKSSED